MTGSLWRQQEQQFIARKQNSRLWTCKTSTPSLEIDTNKSSSKTLQTLDFRNAWPSWARQEIFSLLHWIQGLEGLLLANVTYICLGAEYWGSSSQELQNLASHMCVAIHCGWLVLSGGELCAWAAPEWAITQPTQDPTVIWSHQTGAPGCTMPRVSRGWVIHCPETGVCKAWYWHLLGGAIVLYRVSEKHNIDLFAEVSKLNPVITCCSRCVASWQKWLQTWMIKVLVFGSPTLHWVAWSLITNFRWKRYKGAVSWGQNSHLQGNISTPVSKVSSCWLWGRVWHWCSLLGYNTFKLTALPQNYDEVRTAVGGSQMNIILDIRVSLDQLRNYCCSHRQYWGKIVAIFHEDQKMCAWADGCIMSKVLQWKNYIFS